MELRWRRQETKWFAYPQIYSPNPTPQSTKTVEQFVINSDIGFDKEQHKVDEERARKSIKLRLRHQIALQRSFIKNLPYQNPGTKRQNKSNKNANNSNKFKEMMDYHAEFLRIHFPNTKWSKKHCGFWNHPSLECKLGDKCTRRHTCPNCKGNHIQSECPDFKKPDKPKWLYM